MEFITNIFQKISGVFAEDAEKTKIKDDQKKCHVVCDETANEKLANLKNDSNAGVVKEENAVGGKSKRRKGLKNRRRKTRRSTK